jgi:AGZA family xanthine/uracil permease-like MFS transporter
MRHGPIDLATLSEALKPRRLFMNLQTLFKLDAHGTDVRTEILAGVTTFLTMSYIIFVNPSILSTTGMNASAVFVATCLAAALGTFIMAFVANWPIGLAPGMGLNAFFAFTVVKGMGFTWEQALGAVFISGCIFILLTITGVRSWLVAGIPKSLRSAIAAGIGMFLAIIALSNAGVVVANPATKVGLGNLASLPVVLAAGGFLLIALLDYWRVRGAILIGIVAVTLASMALGLTQYHGIVSMPPSIAPTLFKLDILGALHAGFFHIILVFVLVEIFDATGTLTGIARKAGLLKDGAKDGQSGLGRALFADSLAIFSGSLLGTSSTTAYIESASGVQAGGRTGLTALTVGVLFLAALFIAPLAAVVPAYATAPALLYVAGLMMRELLEIDWSDITESVPSALAALIMPFTYSIANGLAFGFIMYAALKLLTGRAREVHPALWVVAALFLLRYALFPSD